MPAVRCKGWGRLARSAKPQLRKPGIGTVASDSSPMPPPSSRPDCKKAVVCRSRFVSAIMTGGTCPKEILCPKTEAFHSNWRQLPFTLAAIFQGSRSVGIRSRNGSTELNAIVKGP